MNSRQKTKVTFRLLLLVSLVHLFPPSLIFANEQTFSVHAPEYVPYAFSLLKKRHPAVSSDEIDLETPVFFNCHTRDKVEGPSALEDAKFYCSATVGFDVSNMGFENFQIDAEGNCLVFKPATVAWVRVEQRGSAHVSVSHDNQTEGLIVDCDDEILTAMAIGGENVPGDRSTFSVDAKRALELAFEAAIENNHDVPPEQIVYGDLGPTMSITCPTTPRAGGPSLIYRDFGNCSASVMFSNQSVMLQYRYVEGSSCMIGTATDWITVQIGEEGLAEVDNQKNQGGGRAHGVKCDDEFYDSPLPLIESPRGD